MSASGTLSLSAITIDKACHLKHKRGFVLALMFLSTLFCRAAMGQDSRTPQPLTNPQDFRSIPIFGCARLDVRGDVEISVFLFEDPVEGTQQKGKVFRFIQRYSPERIRAVSAIGKPLTNSDLRRYLQKPSVVLLKNGDTEIMDFWLRLFNPETLVIHAPPAAAEMEEVAEASEFPSPRYGDNPPEFLFALNANSQFVTLRSAKSETLIASDGKMKSGIEPTGKLPGNREVSIVNRIDDFEIETDKLVRIRTENSGVTVEPFSPSSRSGVPCPCLFFKPNERARLSSFYTSIINPNALTLAQGLKVDADNTTRTNLATSTSSKEERAKIAVKTTHRLRTVRTLIQRRDFPAAIQVLDEVIQNDREDPLPHYLRAYSVHQNGNTTEAINSITKAVDLERKRPVKDWYKQFEWLQGPSRVWLDETRQEMRGK